MPTLKLLDSLLMTALLHTAQASVRAMIFDFGREVGVYSALRLELRTVVCGSRGQVPIRCSTFLYKSAISEARAARKIFGHPGRQATRSVHAAQRLR